MGKDYVRDKITENGCEYDRYCRLCGSERFCAIPLEGTKDLALDGDPITCFDCGGTDYSFH